MAKRDGSRIALGIVGAVMATLLGVILLMLHVMIVCAVGSAIWWAVDAAKGQQLHGTIDAAASHSARGRSGIEEQYCSGSFTADGATVTTHRVRIYHEGLCIDTRGDAATLVHGLFAPVSAHLVGPEDNAMAFNGLFGMTDGAVVSWRAFRGALWPFIFLVPVTALADAGLIVLLRRAWRRRLNRRLAMGLRRRSGS